MAKQWYAILILIGSIISPWAFSEKAFVLVFLEDAPLRFIKVAVDGKIIGVTNAKGLVEADLETGPHKLYLISDDNAVPVRFNLPENGQIEISAVYNRDSEIEPVVKSQIFSNVSDDAGYIVGRVMSPSGIAIEGATVEVTDLSLSTQTDEEGIYSLEVPRGLHSVQASQSGFQPSASTAIRVFADLGANATFKLFKQPASGPPVSLSAAAIEEVVTLGVFNPTDGSENLERYASSIVSAVDADEIARFGDSDIGAVLGRIVGLTVIDDKYANVRGLDGRYISTEFNGILMPSTDPLRRDIQLDLFPSNIVETIEVQKSFTADQLASTTGGSISVITKSMPDERSGSFAVSIGANSDFTGDTVQGYRDSATEEWGFDGGLRDVHSGVLEATNGARSLTICDPDLLGDLCTRQEVALAYALTFKPDYDSRPITADPDVGFDGSFGDRYELDQGDLGYYIAGSYGRSTGYRGDATLSNPNGLDGGYTRTKDNVAVSGYGYVGYEHDSGEVSAKTTLLRSTDDVTRQTSATDVEENVLDATILEYVERQMFSQSFNAVQDIQTMGLDSQIEWRAGYSETDRLEPDRRQYYGLDGFLATSSVERRWSDLNEVSKDLGVDYSISFDWGQANYSTVEFGALISDKERTVDLYRFGVRLGDKSISLDMANGVDELLSIENFAGDRFRLRAATANTDSYESQEEINAYFVKLTNELGENWTAEIGARVEDFSQLIVYPNSEGSENILEADGVYPALNVSWRVIENIQLRLGYSQTVSYPGLIERSASQSYDPTTDDPIFGSPNLSVSDVDNLDLRLEYYFGAENRLSIALFNKEIDNPIERAIPDASGSAASGITFRNQDSAELNGIEIDFKTLLVDTDERSVFLNGNISFIDSEVALGAKSLQLEGTGSDGRKLQGQSEYLANLQLGYDHFPSSQKATLLVNYFDDRIYRVARGAALGPIIEKGRAIVDFNYEKTFSDNWTVKLKVKNLTNEAVAYSQNVNEVEIYETGTSVNLSISYSL